MSICDSSVDNVPSRRLPPPPEWLSPAYLSSSLPRPTYSGLPDTVDYGSAFTLAVTIGDASDVRVALMDFGFVRGARAFDDPPGS